MGKKCKERGIEIHSNRCWGCNQRNYRAGKTCQTLIEELKKAKPTPPAAPISLELKKACAERLKELLDVDEIDFPTYEEVEAELLRVKKKRVVGLFVLVRFI